MRVHVLASGSSGNALVVECGSQAVLLDCGLGPRVLAARLAEVGVAPERLAGLVISHEHHDHVKGLAHFCKRFDVPVYATMGTWNALGGIVDQGEVLGSGRPLSLAGLTLHPVPTSHDAAEPVAFVMEGRGLRLGLVTDTGVVTELLLDRLAGCHALFLEANHDLDMLRFGPYPFELKKRIASRHGHLSNEQARKALERLVHSRLRQVVAMHLSQENNDPSLVRRELGEVLAGSPVKLSVASQREPLSLALK
ncbi:MAG: MBL fold metallo-hydrolase [Thermoanaerobaculum sp.]|nr:MBL fold metallo-hydrolase [Thermoanaerobaculum sp.]